MMSLSALNQVDGGLWVLKFVDEPQGCFRLYTLLVEVSRRHRGMSRPRYFHLQRIRQHPSLIRSLNPMLFPHMTTWALQTHGSGRA